MTAPAPEPAPKTAYTCPLCDQKTLVTHCNEDSKSCGWHHCRNKACDAMLDLTKRRGHALTPGHQDKRVRVTLPAGGK